MQYAANNFTDRICLVNEEPTNVDCYQYVINMGEVHFFYVYTDIVNLNA